MTTLSLTAIRPNKRGDEISTIFERFFLNISKPLEKAVIDQITSMHWAALADQIPDCVFNHVLVGMCIDCAGGIRFLVINSPRREA